MYPMAPGFTSSPPCFREWVKGASSATTSTVISSFERIRCFFSLAILMPASANHLYEQFFNYVRVCYVSADLLILLSRFQGKQRSALKARLVSGEISILKSMF